MCYLITKIARDMSAIKIERPHIALSLNFFSHNNTLIIILTLSSVILWIRISWLNNTPIIILTLYSVMLWILVSWFTNTPIIIISLFNTMLWIRVSWLRVPKLRAKLRDIYNLIQDRLQCKKQADDYAKFLDKQN